MMKSFNLTLHIFRRDLRLHDNTALSEAMRLSGEVIPCFILDDRQVEEHPYRSGKALQFMAASLEDLDRQLTQAGGRLYLFSGKPEDIVERLVKSPGISAVFAGRDYTPFSRERDSNLEDCCRKHHIPIYFLPDSLLHEPENCLKSNGQPYTVFTPFLRRASQLPVDGVKETGGRNFYRIPIPGEEPVQQVKRFVRYQEEEMFLKGGRTEALELLENIARLQNYDSGRNIPAVSGTSLLSAHNKFGTVSIREVYHTIIKHFGSGHTLIRELYWRDFFTHIAWHFPRVFGHAFHSKYDRIEWENDPDKFAAWCEGRTGFPLVDAGMRQLNHTGWMHNRLRMVTASFLVKDLHTDWRMGEQYFARKLIDYDPSVNNGNWQWAASTGCDAQPYFRIFNPWLQQKRYDPRGIFIRQWIPELRDISIKQLHNLYRAHPPGLQYPEPLTDHQLAASAIRDLYAGLSG